MNETINNNAQVNEVNNAQVLTVPQKQEYSCKILSITTSSDYSKRLFIQTDKEAIQFDQIGKPCKSTSFGLQYGNLINMISAKCPMASIMDATCGRKINVMLLNCLLSNATIKVERTLKVAGEEREIEGVYENDTVVTKITDIRINMQPMMQQIFMSSLQKIGEQSAVTSSFQGVSMN